MGCDARGEARANGKAATISALEVAGERDQPLEEPAAEPAEDQPFSTKLTFIRTRYSVIPPFSTTTF
jgi:hypothetical protein